MLLNFSSGFCIQGDVNLCHIALRIYFHKLIRKWIAWTAPCRPVKTLSVTINQISRAGVWFDKVCSPFSGEQLPSHVTWCNFISLSKQFSLFGLSKWTGWKLACRKGLTQDECFSFKTSASFSSAVESHPSRITSMLLAHPKGNSFYSRETAEYFQVNEEIIHLYLYSWLPN